MAQNLPKFQESDPALPGSWERPCKLKASRHLENGVFGRNGSPELEETTSNKFSIIKQLIH